MPLELPPLRQHPEDIADLAARFLAHFAQRNATPVRELAPDALAVLLRHAWPGNIRELENLLSRAAVMSGSENKITAADLPQSCVSPDAPESDAGESATAGFSLVGRTLDEIEREVLVQTLAACQESRTLTARMLGVSEKTVYNMMRRHGLAAPAPREALLAAG